MLLESRIHQAIKRNVLRETISEDLEWAQCIKNENEELDKIRYEKVLNINIQETRSLQSTPERKAVIGGDQVQRERSCDRIFGSASSRRRFKKSSRINSRRSSISSNMQKGLHKSKSKDILNQSTGNSNVLLETKSLQMLNKDGSKSKRIRDSSRDSYDSHRIIGRSSLGSIQPKNLFQNCLSSTQGTNNQFYQTDDRDSIKDDFSLSQYTNYGSYMNQMITSMKYYTQQKTTSFRMSSNAMKYLFPIRE